MRCFFSRKALLFFHYLIIVIREDKLFFLDNICFALLLIFDNKIAILFIPDGEYCYGKHLYLLRYLFYLAIASVN